jgi:hypothetical protein
MSKMPSYAISEEIVLQTVEVLFRKDPSWEVSFTNPTAGPWKMIKFGNYVGGSDLRFLKEEDRPDLITFSSNNGLFLILEAKDDISKLTLTRRLNGNLVHPQLEKSIKVFIKERERINTILRESENTELLFPENYKGYFILSGYIYFDNQNGSINVKDTLADVHENLANSYGSPDLCPCAIFRVFQNGLDLMVGLDIYNMEEKAKEKFVRIIPFSAA